MTNHWNNLTPSRENNVLSDLNTITINFLEENLIRSPYQPLAKAGILGKVISAQEGHTFTGVGNSQ